MKDVTLYYNPRCGTCQKVKARLEERGLRPRLVEYLKSPPSVDVLREILRKLGEGPAAITRLKEPLWAEKAGDPARLGEAEWLALLSENPELLQRPILVAEDRALVARPAETVDRFFEK